ncbi:MAG: hypothetical protein E7324_09105, partial [Clostridiales bacterium]|nr:hypothetical protein [Clostridiales bacterium]
MFDNIGGKIKKLAVIVCWLGIVGSVIGAIALWASSNRYNDMTGIGFAVLIGGCLFSWIGSFATYAFGELVENSAIQAGELGVLNQKQSELNKALQGSKDQDNLLKALLEAQQKTNELLSEGKYNAAMAMMKEGKFEEALATFAVIESVVDCAEPMAVCRAALRDRAYDEAVALMQAGEYEKARDAFKDILAHKDSQALRAACIQALQEQKYQHALSLMTSGQFDEAAREFSDSALMGYQDSIQKFFDCKNAVKEMNYQHALGLKNCGNYQEAAAAFEKLGDYEDAGAQIIACREAIMESRYRAAQQLLENGKAQEAMEAFLELDNYRDSKAQVQSIFAAHPELKKLMLAPGDTLTFGNYMIENGFSRQPIQWQVLAREETRALLLSQYALDCRPYKKIIEGSVNWATSDIRAWLNKAFLETAFTPEEQAEIIAMDILDGTNDKIFLLSVGAAEKYAKNLACQPTAYAT